jgi:ribonuclease G
MLHKLKPGQEMIVQVKKEPAGEKGHLLTNLVTLPGRLTVLLPFDVYTGVSKKISDDAERSRLVEAAGKLKPEGMGLLVRTAAEGATYDNIKRDIEALEKLWSTIYQRAERAVAPALIHRDEGLEHRAVRDMLSGEVRAFLTDDMARCDRARSAAEIMAPEHVHLIKHDAGETRLFDRYRVHSQIDKALSARVWLKSGGFLVFDYTEALTVIDVNTGKFIGQSSLSDTVSTLNLEAAEEIARQLRLRNIGGIIIIDFIDMDRADQRDNLIKAFRQHVKRDRINTKVLGFTALGLVEMTRKKTGQPLRATVRNRSAVRH